VLHGFSAADPKVWGILALHVLAVASFTSLMAVLVGRWAILPRGCFFTILGNSASGGAVSPPLLPAPFAFISQWLPSGATVTALRDAIYFRGYQHVRPVAVLAGWAAVLFTAWLLSAHRRERDGEALELIAP
jgi:ABC-type multidrug transport system permease subunit